MFLAAHSFWNKSALWTAFVFTTLLGAVTCWAAPTLVSSLAVPSNRPIGAQHLYSVLTHPLAQPSISGWFWWSIHVIVGGLLVSRALTRGQQMRLLVSGLIVGSTAFELMAEGQFFAGSGMVVFGLFGGLSYLGFRMWSTLSRAWKAYIIVAMLTLAVGLLEQPPLAKSYFAAAFAGWVLVFHSKAGEYFHREPPNPSQPLQPTIGAETYE